MHNCVRCGKAAASLEEINRGCGCGSKIFVFNKESPSADANPQESAEGKIGASAQGRPDEVAGCRPSQGAQGSADLGSAAAALPDGTERGGAPQVPQGAAGSGGKKSGGRVAWEFGVQQQTRPAPAADAKEGEKKQEPSPGRVPESYFARVAFTSEDVENVKIVKEGVFLLDLNAMRGNPLVLKDEEGVYYVKLPFDQGRAVENFGRNFPAAGCADFAAKAKAEKGGGKKEE